MGYVFEDPTYQEVSPSTGRYVFEGKRSSGAGRSFAPSLKDKANKIIEDKFIAPGEVALSLTSGIAEFPLARLGKIIDLARGKSEEEAQATEERMAQKWSYQPQTEMAEKILDPISKATNFVARTGREMAAMPAESWGLGGWKKEAALTAGELAAFGKVGKLGKLGKEYLFANKKPSTIDTLKPNIEPKLIPKKTVVKGEPKPVGRYVFEEETPQVKPEIVRPPEEITNDINTLFGEKPEVTPEISTPKLAEPAPIESVKFTEPTPTEAPKPVEVAQPTSGGVKQPTHRPMTVESGSARLHDLTPAFGEDIYGDNALQYFGTGEKLDIQTLRILKSVRNKPEADVTIYRAIPKDEIIKPLVSGDWVTVNKQYAKEHGEGILEGNYKIIEHKVKAKDLTTNADSFNEQGYYPDLVKGEPLSQEAKKYGSAEEFVNSKRTVESEVKFWEDNAKKELDKITNGEVIVSKSSTGGGWLYDIGNGVQSPSPLSTKARTIEYANKQKEQSIAYLKDGYVEGNTKGIKNYFVTKSQLTDIYNQAKPKPAGEGRTVPNIVSDVKTILGEKEKGSISGKKLSQEQMDARDRLIEDARKAGKDIKDFLAERGLTPENIDRFIAMAPKIEERQGITGKEYEATKLAKRTELAAIEHGLTKEGFGDLTGYEKKPDFMKEQAKLGQANMDTDWNASIEMGLGKITPLNGALPETMYKSVEKRAIQNNDLDTLYRLSTESTVGTGASIMGQRIKALDSGIVNSPVDVARDISKVRLETSRKTGRKPLSSKALDELSKKIETVENELINHEVSKAVKKARLDIAREQRQTKRIYKKGELSVEREGLYKELNSILGGQLNVGLDPKAVKVLSDIMVSYVKEGIITGEGIIDAIYTDVRKLGIDLSKRDIADAISGYGKTAHMSKEELKVQIREAKRQMRLISAYEDATKGKVPLKSGLQRDLPSDRVRELTKQVKDMMREKGIITAKTPEQQWKTSLDAVKTRLKNQIVDLTKQIETGEKKPKQVGIKYDVEANVLKEQRDVLKKVIEEIEGKPQMSAEQKVRNAVSAVEKSITEYERRITEKDLTPQKKVSTTPLTPELKALRDTRDTLKKTYQDMQKEARPQRTPEEQWKTSLASYKTRLTNEISDMERNLSTGNLVKKEVRHTVLDEKAQQLKTKRDALKRIYNAGIEVSGRVTKEELTKLVDMYNTSEKLKAEMEQGGNRFAYGASKIAYENYIEDLKGSNDPLLSKLKERKGEFKTTWEQNRARAVKDVVKDSIQAITDNSVAMVASLDDSFLGRQGLVTLLTDARNKILFKGKKSVWYDAAKKSFIDFYNTVGGKNAHDALMADIYSRPNYLNGEYVNAKIMNLVEEQFPTTLPERIPLGIGRTFRASEFAFTGSALRMRTGLYDMFSEMAKEKGKPWGKLEQEDMGRVINSMTARGKWGNRGENGLIRLVLWAPKMLKADIDVLTMHMGRANLETSFAKHQAALNLVTAIAEVAVVMAVSNAISPNSAEVNPTSSNFGKIRIKNTGYLTDFLGIIADGLGVNSNRIGKYRTFSYAGSKATIITLAARLIMGETKNPITGKITPYSDRYGSANAFDAVINFLTNKTTPLARTVVDKLKGQFFDQTPFTWGKAGYQIVTPISLRNMIEADKRKEIPKPQKSSRKKL